MRAIISTVMAAAITIGGVAAGSAVTADAHDGPSHRPDDHAYELELSKRQERLVKLTTWRFRSPKVAIAEGYIPTDECVELPGEGGMGYHYVNPQLIDDVVNPARPEVLVYYRDKPNGRLRLGAVEYFVPDADGDLATDTDRPSLFGHPFDGPMPGHSDDMPVHYDLHAWVFEHNPAGTLAPWNPAVSCPA